MDSIVQLIAQFDEMVRRDGGSLELIGDDGTLARIGYRIGSAPSCESGACVMPHLELEALMAETLARRAPGRRISVQLITG